MTFNLYGLTFTHTVLNRKCLINWAVSLQIYLRSKGRGACRRHCECWSFICVYTWLYDKLWSILSEMNTQSLDWKSICLNCNNFASLYKKVSVYFTAKLVSQPGCAMLAKYEKILLLSKSILMKVFKLTLCWPITFCVKFTWLCSLDFISLPISSFATPHVDFYSRLFCFFSK